MTSNPAPTRAPLAVIANGAAPDDPACLARVCFARETELAATDTRVPLTRLAGNFHSEVWQAAATVKRGRAAGIEYACSDDVCFGHASFGESAGGVAEMAETAYRQVFDLQAMLGFGHLLRIWHCLGSINAGTGETERYKLFCQGRGRAIDECMPADTRLPAATVVGGDKPGLHLHFVASKVAPAAIENPRQVSAYRYPRQYGRRSPAFVRAARVDWPGGARQLFVSGTASIVGHATRHRGDTTAQLRESLANLRTLLGEAGGAFADAGLAGLDLLKVYLRHPADLPAVRAIIAESAGPDLPWLCLRADLCRADLLLEVEGQITR